MSDEPEVQFWAVSVYGAMTKRGLVEVTYGAETHTIPPSKAREMAVMLLEAAASAEGDEALMRVTDQVGVSPQRAIHLLRAMRSERALIFQKARREAREAIAYDQRTSDDEPADGAEG